mgnify:CR=1 FL=1
MLPIAPESLWKDKRRVGFGFHSLQYQGDCLMAVRTATATILSKWERGKFGPPSTEAIRARRRSAYLRGKSLWWNAAPLREPNYGSRRRRKHGLKLPWNSRERGRKVGKMTGTTVREWLEELAESRVSSEDDAAKMQVVLQKIGFPGAVCIHGVVYLEGRGQPIDIHTVARVLLHNVLPTQNKIKE